MGAPHETFVDKLVFILVDSLFVAKNVLKIMILASLSMVAAVVTMWV